MAKRLPVTLAGLDIGTAKTAVVIAQLSSSTPQILGLAETPSIGVTKGCITSPEAAARAILQSWEQALRSAGNNRPSTLYVSFNGETTTVKDCLVDLKPGRSTAGHSKYDDLPLIPAGLEEEDSALHLIPPRGFQGRNLFEAEAGARAVTAPNSNIRNLYKAVRLAGLKIDGLFFGPVAAAEVLLSKAEKEFGTVLIDIGAGVTSVSIFDQGELRETTVIPVGSEHLAGDLAIGLHTSLKQAVDILNSYILTGNNQLDQAGLIIEARFSEILRLIGSALESFQYPGLLPGGAVFCGGVTLMEGFAGFAGNILNVPVRVGNIEVVGHTMNITFANALGLVKYGARGLTNSETKLTAKWETGALMDRLMEWLHGRKKNRSRL